ncbi:asparaginase domain-containing protein [Hydrogenimonas sp.]
MEKRNETASSPLLVLNTGGTFNKRYDPVAGELRVPADDRAVAAALAPMAPNLRFEIEGLLYKDSLEMTEEDRAALTARIARSASPRVVVVHGTDTMHLSAEAVAEAGLERCVVFTGAMVPFSIDPVEAAANLALAVAGARTLPMGVYVAMHGLLLLHDRIEKDRSRGLFVALP